jgi:hypothetical protein
VLWQYKDLIRKIFALQVLGIYEKHIFPLVAMAFLSSVADGVVTINELSSFVTRLLSSLQGVQTSSKSLPSMSDQMVDDIMLSKLEGSADGGCGPDVILLHPALCGIYKVLGRQTSIKLIRHVTLSLMEFITGRRTAADYPTATEAHGFDPSVSELLDTEFRKVDGFISPSFLSVMSYMILHCRCFLLDNHPTAEGLYNNSD